jgi:hypothetical protein
MEILERFERVAGKALWQACCGRKREKLRMDDLWLTHVTLATWKAEIGRIMARGQPGQMPGETPISKITRAKWTEGVAQAVEHLLCKP